MPRTKVRGSFFDSMREIEIRLCKTWEECVECEELQKQVWEMPDYRDAVPANFLITAVKNGGLLVGAFEGEGMVGFAFGFLGSEGKGEARVLKHASHMLAVVPESRFRGLGAEMKWFQRAEALKQGLGLMTWTYDPLQALNANLNLNRLGAIARRYYRNAYGEMTDALNAGLASDRFEVEWYMQSRRVNERREGPFPVVKPAEAHVIYQVEWDGLDLPILVSERDPVEGINLVEIPVEINKLKAMRRDEAIRWREQTRSTFERAFAAGFAATGMVKTQDESGRGRAWYVLTNANDPELVASG